MINRQVIHASSKNERKRNTKSKVETRRSVIVYDDGIANVDDRIKYQFYKDRRNKTNEGDINQSLKNDPLLIPDHEHFSGYGHILEHKRQKDIESKPKYDDTPPQQAAHGNIFTYIWYLITKPFKAEVIESDAKNSEVNERRKRQKRVLDSPQLVDDEELNTQHNRILTQLPWSWKLVTFDKLNTISPIDSLNYFFVSHTTGPSAAYLVFSFIFITFFIAIISLRFDLQRFSEATFVFQLRQTDSEELPQVGIALNILSTHYRVIYEQCQMFTNSDVTSLQVTQFACTNVVTQQCNINNKLYHCPQTTVEVLGSQGREKWAFLRARIQRCASCGEIQDDLIRNAHLTIVTPTVRTNHPYLHLLDEVLVTNTHAIVENISNSTVLAQLYYQYMDVTSYGRFGVNSERGLFVAYSGQHRKTKYDHGNDLDWATIHFGLEPSKLEINLRPVSVVDVMAVISAFAALLISVGLIFRAYNRWHFRNYGGFITANIPSEYIKDILDPATPFAAPGVKELQELDHKFETSETDFITDPLKYDVATVRKRLQPLIKASMRRSIAKNFA